MKGIELRFEKRLGSFSLSVDLAVPGRGITALFGHSGSGKTTLLRLIAGLERCEGHLVVNGEVWQDAESFRPPHRRPVGYVFQEASLFPHLNVLRNLEYGLKRVPRHEQRVLLEEAVALLGIESLLYRSPVNLSGGERQRVAIARALLTSPRVLLMDEPLAALDEQRKQEILPFLERMHDELDIPVLYVSHSLKEVVRLSDHMVWMEAGRAIGHGPLSDVLARVDLEQAWEEEAGAVVAATVAFHDETDHLTALETHCGRLWVRRMEVQPGHRVRVRLPARDISLSLEPDRRSSILNVWQVVVEKVEEAGPGQALVRMRCRAGGPVVIARITARSRRVLGLRPGQAVYARMKSVALLV